MNFAYSPLTKEKSTVDEEQNKKNPKNTKWQGKLFVFCMDLQKKS